jgi:hypothetical protein
MYFFPGTLLNIEAGLVNAGDCLTKLPFSNHSKVGEREFEINVSMGLATTS